MTWRKRRLRKAKAEKKDDGVKESKVESRG